MSTVRSLQILLILGTLIPAAFAADTPTADTPTADTPTADTSTVSTSTVGDTSHRIVHEGIAIEFEMETLGSGATQPPPVPQGATPTFREGETTAFRFHITDTTTGTPLSGVYPAAWMDLRPPEDQDTCRDKVEAFIAGTLLSPPELDLNVYYVLSLNLDATISVVDPLFGFGSTKLLDMIFLDAPGEDWVLSEDQRTLYVAMPKANPEAVVDTSTWKITEQVLTGQHPTRLALQGDGRYLWVGHEGSENSGKNSAEDSGVTVIDTASVQEVARITTGRGQHEIVLDPEARFAFVTNRSSGTLSVIDVRTLTKVRDLAVGERPVSLAYSTLARAAYVVDEAAGSILAIDGERHEIVGRTQAEPGLGRIAFAPGDRFALVVNPEHDVVHVLDTASHTIVQTGDMEDGPDQVAFSDHLAYVRHRDSATVLMIPLEQVGVKGARLSVVDFPGGQNPMGWGAPPSPAAGIVQAPGATAVLVANAADRAIYFYKEGMAAPMGHFQNYGRPPRAVLAVDRSLSEKTPGTYETAAALRRPGTYDVAFFLDTPRTIHCFQVEVQPNPQLEAQRLANRPLRVEPLLDDVTNLAGEEVALRFQLLDPATSKPVADRDDVQVLAFRGPGLDQQRLQAQHLGGGIYEARYQPSQEGLYQAYVSCPSAGLAPNAARPLVFEVSAAQPL